MKEPNTSQPFGWIKCVRGKAAQALHTKPNANHLLNVIAQRINWGEPNQADGTEIGETLISAAMCGLSRAAYRAALDRLVKMRKIEVITTTPTTRSGTVVRLVDTSVYDLNIVTESQPYDTSLPVAATQMTTKTTNEGKKATTKAATGAALRYVDKNGAGQGVSEHDGEAATSPATTGTTNEGEKAATLAASDTTPILKNQEEEEKEKEDQQSDGSVVSVDFQPDTEDAKRAAKEIQVAYPALVRVMCGQFTRFRSHSFDDAVEFFKFNRDWTATDVCLVGLKALIATSKPEEPGDRLWWCRNYAKDVARLVANTKDNQTPILEMARELGHDIRHFSPDESLKIFNDMFMPYVEAEEKRDQARAESKEERKQSS